MTWPMRRVSELCLVAVDCVNKTAPTVDYETPFKMIRTTNVKGGFIDLDHVRFVAERTFERWTRRSKPQYGEVILSREAPVGEVGRFTSDDGGVFLGQRLFHYRPDPDLLDWNYLAFVLQSHDVQGRLRSMGFGATVDHIRVPDAENLSIPCPPINVQRRIGGVLSVYDDLIENNRRRMALLEEAARQLYREWFVRLRFPGHEHTRITNGVPEAWEKIHLSDAVDTQYGYTETATDEPVGPKFLRGTDINKSPFIDWSTVPHCPIDETLQRKYQLRVGDIVIIRMADPGKVAIVERDIDAVFASYLIRLLPTDPRLRPYYLFYVLSDDAYQGFISGVSTGSTRKTASAPLLVDFHLLLPPQTLLRAFEDSVRPLRQQITTLLIQNEKLRAARDLLLPRLMSGEIAV
jgi:type I restriction enzyme, S subunit